MIPVYLTDSNNNGLNWYQWYHATGRKSVESDISLNDEQWIIFVQAWENGCNPSHYRDECLSGFMV